MSSSSAPGGSWKPNRLAAEHSPYLLQHAHNPVDWYPWGDEAFEKARKLDIPIFLSSNIRVFCRCWPLNTEETQEGASMAIDFDSAKDGELIVRGHVSSKKVFKFDSVFNPEEDQGDCPVIKGNKWSSTKWLHVGEYKA
ncbi:hypothetical protein ZWY2020_029469 [Hordeum vulgare]|nr:hypothetical protein ZWY2020_029469 [Hordeum vulgare]